MVINNIKGQWNKGIYLLLLLHVMVGTSCKDGQNKKEATSTIQKDSTMDPLPVDSRTILFVGTSLTAGYGLDPEQAYPALIQQRLDSLGVNFRIINAGISGETSSSGKNRIAWLLKQQIDIFVLELGANDGLRGLPVDETKKNLSEIIQAVKKKYPSVKVILAGMQVPPNMGKKYSQDFKAIYPEIASSEKAYLIPFLLDKVAGETALNQQDGIHPTIEGQKILADNVWVILKELI